MSNLLKKLKNTLIGGKGYTPGMLSTLGVGALGGIGNATLGWQTGDPDRGTFTKVKDALVDTALGSGMAITGKDRFGLAGAAAATGLGMGASMGAKELNKKWQDANVDSPFLAGLSSPVSDAVLGSVGGTMFTTSLLRGGGLRRLGTLGVKKLVDRYSNNPIAKQMSQLLDATIKGKPVHEAIADLPAELRDLIVTQKKELGDKWITSPQITEAASALEANVKAPREALIKQLRDDGIMSAPSRWFQSSGDWELTSKLDNKEINPETFNPVQRQLYDAYIKEQSKVDQLRNFMGLDFANSAADQLLGKPGQSGYGMMNVVLAALGDARNPTKRGKDLLADSNFADMLLKKFRSNPELAAKYEDAAESARRSLAEYGSLSQPNPSDILESFIGGLNRAEAEELGIPQDLHKFLIINSLDKNPDFGRLFKGLNEYGSGFSKLTSKLLDNYLGSPATTDLVSRYGSIQNIPAWEYIKAQGKEDMVDGSVAGLAFAPLFYPGAVVAAYGAKNKAEEERKKTLMYKLKNLVNLE